MANRLHEEDIRLNISVNGNEAQKEIYDLEKQNISLKDSIRNVEKEMKKFRSAKQKESEEYKNLQKQVESYNNTLNKNRDKITELTRTLKVNEMTQSQLKARAKELQLALSKMVAGADRNKMKAQLEEINTQLGKMNGLANQQRGAFGSASSWLGTYQTHILSIVATITGLTYSFQKWIDISGQLSDAEADVMKTTGLTAEQIKALNQQINTLDTRTSRIELLKLAEEAGRLGKEGLKDISGFMVVADKLKVALGDDLGGEEAIRDVGKLVTTYRVGAETGKEFEGAMEALGSAINEVSASGSNQASFLVDYLNRMSGIAAQAKLSASDNLGYAATYDEIGQSAEVASTAMNKVILDMFKSPGEYAKIAKMSVQDFNQLLNTDSNAAMLKFLEGLQGNEAGLQAMAIKMDELDAGGTRGIQALSALASNLDILKERQMQANTAMQEATSLQNEYNIKNNNLAAVLDKIKKTISNWFTSDQLVEWLTTVVTWFAKFIGAVKDTDNEVSVWRDNLLTLVKVIAAVGAGLISYNAWLKLTALWTNRNTASSLLYTAQLKLQNIMAGIAIVKAELYAAAQLLLAGNVRGAIATIRALNTTMLASPWGIVLGLVTALTTAFILFRNSSKEAYDMQKMLNDVNVEATKSITSQKLELSKLLVIARDETRSKEERLKAIKKLNDISPQYLGQLNLENINTAKATELVSKYTAELYKNARAKALQSKYEQLVNERIDVNNTTSNDYKGSVGKAFDYIFGQTEGLKNYNDVLNFVEKNEAKVYKTKEAREKRALALYKQLGLEQKHLKLARLDAQMIDVGNELSNLNDYNKDDNNTNDVTTPTTYTIPGTGDKKKTGKTQAQKDAENAAKKEAEARKKYLEDLLKDQEKTNEEILKIKRDLQDAEIELMDEGFEKERAQLNNQHQKKIEDLKAQKVTEESFKTLNNDKAKYTNLQANSKDKNAIAEYDRIIKNIEQMKQTFLIKNTEIDELILQEELKFYSNLKTIQNKEDLKNVDILMKNIEAKRNVLKTAQLMELQSVNDVATGKEALQGFLSAREINRLRNFDQVKKALTRKQASEQLALEEQLMLEQITALNNIITGVDFETMDFQILPEEQQQEMLQKLEELKNKLIELGIEKEKLKGEGQGGEGSILGAADGGNVDIFGMTGNDWLTLFDNLEKGKLQVEDVAKVVGMLINVYKQYSDLVAQQENKQLENFQQNNEAKKTNLQQQLDQGYISQETYNKEVQKLDDAYNRRKAQIEYKQAKREKAMAIASSLMNTAQAVTKALASTPPPTNYVLAGIVGGMGLLQTALIAKQPLPSPGFADGYVDIQREQDGKQFRAKKGGRAKSGLVGKPTHFLAGEQGQYFPEMIISGPDWKGFSPATKMAVQNELRGIKSPGYEGGSLPDVASMDNSQLIALLNANRELLTDLKINGIQAYLIDNMRLQQQLKNSAKEYEKFISKTKI